MRLKEGSGVRWDVVSLGEILLRFDPADERIQKARRFEVWDGGAEYNVAKNLAGVFGARTAVATALADNPLGRLAEDFARQGGVDTSLIRWKDAAVGSRNGLYFIERGFGLRAPASCFDRSGTEASRIVQGDFNWDDVFDKQGTRWFHTGGIFAGLSDSTFGAALEAMSTARGNGCVVSYDLNYRHSLWKGRGGMEAANEMNRQLLAHTDIVFGIPDYRPAFADLDLQRFQIEAEQLKDEFPNLKLIAATLRDVKSASLHDFTAVCWFEGAVHKASDYLNINVLDRVGSGDAFASGLIHGLLDGRGIEYALECAAAHAGLVMSTPGDNSSATLAEIESLMKTGVGHVDR